jgi:transposase-like protein
MNLYKHKNIPIRIAYFPDPYADEDYRNLIIRYCHKTNTAMFEAMKKLFNINSKSPNYFPYNLMYLGKKLPYDEVEFIGSFIGNNTFFPAYSLFLPLQLSTQIMCDFNEVTSNKDLAILSLRHNISKEFRFCSRCMKEDYEQGKEPYAHRIHQFNNLDICVFHKTKLIEKCPLCNEFLYEENNKKPRISVIKCKNGHLIDSEECGNGDFANFKLKVLEGLQFLFENYWRLKGFPLYDFYKVYLIKKGYMNFSGKLSNKAFYKDFLEFFPEDLFIQLGYNLKQLNNRLALRIFTKDKYSYDPILHILSIIFLADSLEEFFNEPLPNLECKIPFGNGPWHCLNITCKYYNEKVIKKCQTHGTRRDNIYVDFLCLHCGLHYQVKFDDNVHINESRLWIKDYGSVWKSRLEELYNNGLGQREIARELNVDKNTVQKYIKNIKMERLRKPNQNSTNNSNDNTVNEKASLIKRKFNKREYQNFKNKIEKLSKNKDLTRTQICELIGPRKYSLVMSVEPEWMNEILPKKISNFREKDWGNIDLNLSQVLERKAIELNQINPTRRITKYLILSRLDSSDKKRIIHHPHKLPMCSKKIDSYIESKEAYQLRIIPHTIKYMKETGYSLEPERIYRYQRFEGCSEKVKKEILNFINNYSLENHNTELY